MPAPEARAPLSSGGADLWGLPEDSGEDDAQAGAAAQQQASDTDRPPHVLELRVHGVNNTTAFALLDLAPDQVRLIAGDKLGSFWEPTADALVASEKSPRGSVPAHITREAYSWGGMVRTTPNLGNASIGGMAAGVIARIGYALLLPYAIANAVQWVRRLKPADRGHVDEEEAPPGEKSAMGRAEKRKSLASEAGRFTSAGLTRLFGVILSALFSTTAVAIALDIGAAQCGADAARCEPLSAVFAPMASWTLGQRFALLAVLPALAVVGLWVLSTISRQRYDVLPGMENRRDVSTGQEESEGEKKAPVPRPLALLSQPGFWSNRMTANLARLHLAVGLFLIAGFVAAQALSAWATRVPEWWWGLCGLAAVGLVAAATTSFFVPTTMISIVERRNVFWPGKATAGILGAGIVVFIATVLTAAFEADAASDAPTRLVGVDVMFFWLTGLGLLIAISGVWWRRDKRPERVAWHGRAPAVLMLLALALAVGTSAIVVFTTANVLNGSAGATALVQPAGEPGSTDDLEQECVCDVDEDGTVTVTMEDAAIPSALHAPASLAALGTAVLLGLLFAVAAAVIGMLRRRDVSERARAWGQVYEPPAPGRAAARRAAERTGDGDGPLDGIGDQQGVLPLDKVALYERIVAKRKFAARIQAAEPVIGIVASWLGVAIAAGIAWTLYVASTGGLWPVQESGFLAVFAMAIQVILDIALPALAWVGVAIVAALSVSGGTGQRPLGIVWDIACYLPRTGHPFGPPCYAERAVPEIAGRIKYWIDAPDVDPDERARRGVVLSAHSMGAVLSVSALALLASSPATRGYVERVSLLTFGTQLRTYFGRILPELLGPDILGTTPTRAPRLLAADPWIEDFREAEKAEAKPPSGIIGNPSAPETALLPQPGVPWISLWRLTDYLGFPAASTRRNAVDVYARELDLTGYMVGVGTHGEYYRTPEYTTALVHLREKYMPPAPEPPGDAPPSSRW